MKKILFVIGGLGIGGTENSLISLLNLINYKDYNVDLLVFDKNGEYKNFVPKEVNIIEFTSKENVMLKTISELKNNFCFSKVMIKRLYYVLKKRLLETFNISYNVMDDLLKDIDKYPKKYDYAIAYDARFIDYIVKKVNADKYISWYHFTYRGKTKSDIYIDEKRFRQLDAIILVSEACEKEMKRIFSRIKDKFYFIPNSINYKIIEERSDEFYPQEYDDNFTICSVGRLESQKNFELAIKACYELKKKNSNFKWFIIGDGSQLNYLQDLIKKYKVEENIKLIGKKNNPYPYMKNADLYVQTSVFEGLCIAVAEALTLKTPIVVSNISGLKEYIYENNGLISDLDPIDLSEKINIIYKNKSKYVCTSKVKSNDTYKLFTELLNKNNIEIKL